MSTLELTLLNSYDRIIKSSEYVSGGLFQLSLKERKTALIALMAVFVALVVFYLYLVGSTASLGISLKTLEAELNSEMIKKSEIEKSLTDRAGIANVSMLLGEGYEEPKDLSVIKREHNVASNQEQIFYQ